MKCYSKFITILLLIMFLMACSTVAFAQPNENAKITKENVKEMLEQAKKGNEKAIQALSKLKCFSKEANKRVNGTKVFAGNSKKFTFDDGSSIVLEYVIQETYQPGTGTEIPAYSNITTDECHSYAIYKWYAYGVEVSRYEVHCRYEHTREPALIEDWDTGSSTLYYSCTPLGTSVLSDVGPYAIGITGRGAWSSTYGGSETVKINTYNYEDPFMNWAEYWIW
jgi:uncharacterized protein YdeI (BOF family)